jgi:hypothetical protein
VDPFQGLASLILGKMKDSLVGLWWKFLFEMGFSATTSFLIVCGVSLSVGTHAGISIGNGMIASCLSMVYLFRKEHSRLTKGMMVALPAIEAEKELQANMQTIQKGEK